DSPTGASGLRFLSASGAHGPAGSPPGPLWHISHPLQAPRATRTTGAKVFTVLSMCLGIVVRVARAARFSKGHTMPPRRLVARICSIGRGGGTFAVERWTAPCRPVLYTRSPEPSPALAPLLAACPR